MYMDTQSEVAYTKTKSQFVNRKAGKEYTPKVIK